MASMLGSYVNWINFLRLSKHTGPGRRFQDHLDEHFSPNSGRQLYIDDRFCLRFVACILHRKGCHWKHLLLSSTAKSQQNGWRFSKSRLQAALRALHTFEAMECQEFLHCCLTCNKPTPPTRWKAHRGVKNSTPTYWLQNNKNLYQKGYYTTLSIRNPARIKRLSKGGWSERFHGYWSIRSWQWFPWETNHLEKS